MTTIIPLLSEDELPGVCWLLDPAKRESRFWRFAARHTNRVFIEHRLADGTYAYSRFSA